MSTALLVRRANTPTKKLPKLANTAMPVIMRRMPATLIARVVDRLHLPNKKVLSPVTVANKAGTPMCRAPLTAKCVKRASPRRTRTSRASCAKVGTLHRKKECRNAKHAHPVLMPMVLAIHPVHCVCRAQPTVNCIRTHAINARKAKHNPKRDRRWNIAPIVKWVFLRIKKV